jgi:hypothetical protein
MSELFDAVEAQRRKEVGMARAASARPALLSAAREIAFMIAERRGEVHMDDVVRTMLACGHDPAELGNAAGSVFRGMAWTGKMLPSQRASTHGRWIKVWALPEVTEQAPRSAATKGAQA